MRAVVFALLAIFIALIVVIPQLNYEGEDPSVPKKKPCAPRPYPPESLAAREEGRTKVDYKTAADGTVIEAEVASSSGYPRLDAASLQHIKTCKFRAGGHSGTVLYKWVLPSER